MSLGQSIVEARSFYWRKWRNDAVDTAKSEVSEEMMAASLPAGVTFPLACHADVESIEEKLQDTQTKNTLVGPIRTNSSIYSTIFWALLSPVYTIQPVVKPVVNTV